MARRGTTHSDADPPEAVVGLERGIMNNYSFLISHEIRGIVALAYRDKAILSSSASLSKIMSTYPNADMSSRSIENMLIRAAADAGVAVEMGRAHLEVLPLPEHH